MRILHTSDWHLGVSLEQAPRHDEHERFLAWLLEKMSEEEIDVLVISGDVFHYMQPSAAAQAQFFDFLADAANTGLRRVVMVAGNHDSPSRFDAPRGVLGALSMHVVGALPAEDNLDRCLASIEGDSGDVELVVVAVPYVSESRLGISTTEKSPARVREEFTDRFGELYRGLADRAAARHPGVPLMATGHLTCVAEEASAREGDFATPIHQFLSIQGLPPSIFGDAYDYVALGHIHRSHRIGSSPAWYSGTPVPTNVVEARSPRYVHVVDFERDARVERLKVPRWRDIFELVGTRDEVLELVAELDWRSEFPPYLYVEVLVDAPGSLNVDPFRQALIERFDEERRPRIVSFKKSLEVEAQDDQKEHVSLDQLTPEEVFERMYRQRHKSEPPTHILEAFRTLLVEREETS